MHVKSLHIENWHTKLSSESESCCHKFATQNFANSPEHRSRLNTSRTSLSYIDLGYNFFLISLFELANAFKYRQQQYAIINKFTCRLGGNKHSLVHNFISMKVWRCLVHIIVQKSCCSSHLFVGERGHWRPECPYRQHILIPPNTTKENYQMLLSYIPIRQCKSFLFINSLLYIEQFFYTKLKI